MKIDIVVYSKSGNTYSVAEKIHKKFLQKGHNSIIHSINIEWPNDSEKNVENMLKTGEIFVFCSPVHGFSLCEEMYKYMDQIKDLKDKKVAFFVTQYFGFPILGGTKAIRQMSSICESKHGEIFWKGVIGWSSKDRESKIQETVEAITSFTYKGETDEQ